VKGYFSWRVQNPSEVFYDVKVDVYAGYGSTSVRIRWSDEAERHSKNVTIYDSGNVTAIASALYGAVVGADDGKNEFTLSYVDSAVVHTGHLLSLVAAFVVLICNNFVQLA